MNVKKLFGKRLATLRESRNLKQHQLARMIGKKDKYISDLETGRTYPRPEMLETLSKALGVPISEFYFFEGLDDDTKVLRKSIEALAAVDDTDQLRKYFRHMLVSRER